MDTTKTITHVSLCAGYGGIDLGLQRAVGNLRTIAFCEIEAFACANLVSKMEAGLLDPAPIWTNLKTCVGNSKEYDGGNQSERNQALRLELSSRRQVESQLGGDSDGASDWMDYAELCIARDNRTDELRLLGNGVLPQTIDEAFITLFKKLIQ